MSSLDKMVSMLNNRDIWKLKMKEAKYDSGFHVEGERDVNNLDIILETFLIAYDCITTALEEIIKNASESVPLKSTNGELEEITWSISIGQFDALVNSLLLIRKIPKCKILKGNIKLFQCPIDCLIEALQQSIRCPIITGTYRMHLKKEAVAQLTLLYTFLHDDIEGIKEYSDCGTLNERETLTNGHFSKSHQGVHITKDKSKVSIELSRLEAEHRALCDAINIFKSALRETGNLDYSNVGGTVAMDNHCTISLKCPKSLTSLEKVNQCVTDASGARRCILECLCEVTEDSRCIQFIERYHPLMSRGTVSLIREQQCSSLLDLPISAVHWPRTIEKNVSIGNNFKRSVKPSLTMSKDLEYYINLRDHRCQNINTTFEVRYFVLERESPSKERAHFKSNNNAKENKHKKKQKSKEDYEINADAIEVRVFEFKRKNVSEEKEIMHKLKTKLHSDPCDKGSNSNQQEEPSDLQIQSSITSSEVFSEVISPIMQKPTRNATFTAEEHLNHHELQQYQTPMHLQHCAVNTSKKPGAPYSIHTKNNPVTLSGQRQHSRECNIAGNKPKSAPPLKFQNKQRIQSNRFRDLFKNNYTPKSDINSSIMAANSRGKDSKTHPLFLSRKCAATNSCERDGVLKQYHNRFRCRGGDCSFARNGNICVEVANQSTTSISVQCDILGGEQENARPPHKMNMRCPNGIIISKCEEKELYDLDYLTHTSQKPHQSRLSNWHQMTSRSHDRAHYMPQQENRRYSSPLCNPLILNNEFDSNMYKKFYDIDIVPEQADDLDLPYKLKEVSSWCEDQSKMYMENGYPITDNVTFQQTSDVYLNSPNCSIYHNEKFSEKDSYQNNYVHPCIMDSNYNSQEDRFPANTIYRSQSSLDNRNTSITEFSKSNIGQYELPTDGDIIPTSNPKMFKVDNYQDRNVYHIQDNECYTNCVWSEDEEKIRNKLANHCDQSRYSIVVSSMSDAETSTQNCGLPYCNEKVLYGNPNFKTGTTYETRRLTSSSCDKTTQLPPITYRSQSLLLQNKKFFCGDFD
ncbi:uncharacterized protein LOC116166923 isoform X3 [Photinus pyralis]|uniref:uncharacterized protein LOC116166923 isoform X3 n=1 Tax=Photinus pyralis TaxID=7054 RepID=UPI0012673BF4|nr:uncharacterized protein LOC116166923 isoform X3 [Photinus pyralis]